MSPRQNPSQLAALQGQVAGVQAGVAGRKDAQKGVEAKAEPVPLSFHGVVRYRQVEVPDDVTQDARRRIADILSALISRVGEDEAC